MISVEASGGMYVVYLWPSPEAQLAPLVVKQDVSNSPQCRFPRPAEAQQLHGLRPDPRHLCPSEGQGDPQRLDLGPVHPDRRGQPWTPFHQDGGDGGRRRGELRGWSPMFAQRLMFFGLFGGFSAVKQETLNLRLFLFLIRCLLSSLSLWSKTDTTATTLAPWSIPLIWTPPRFNSSFVHIMSMNSLLQGSTRNYIYVYIYLFFSASCNFSKCEKMFHTSVNAWSCFSQFNKQWVFSFVNLFSQVEHFLIPLDLSHVSTD